MENNGHRNGVLAAMGRYCKKQDCPVCGLKFWNGKIHAYGGTFNRDKSKQLWCDGVVPINARQEKKDQA